MRESGGSFVRVESTTPHEVKRRIDAGERVQFLDVREQWEHDLARLEPSILIPIRSLPDRYDELDKTVELIVYCHHGVRSLHACSYLVQCGFTHVVNLEGGIDRWSRSVDPTVRTY